MNPSNSTLNLTTRTPIEREELQKLKNIWQSLHDHNDATEFRNPVDWESITFIILQSIRTSRLSHPSKATNGLGNSKQEAQRWSIFVRIGHDR